MSVRSSANRFEIDALLVLRASGLSTVAVSGGTPFTGAYGTYGPSNTVVPVPNAPGALVLDTLFSYWGQNEIADPLEFAVCFQIESIAAASGTPTATFSVLVDSDPNFTSPTPQTLITLPALTVATRTFATITREQLYAAASALGVAMPTGNTPATYVPLYLGAYMAIGGGATTPAVAWNAYVSPIGSGL